MTQLTLTLLYCIPGILFVAGVTSLRMAKTILNSVTSVLEDAVAEKKETEELAEHLAFEYDIDEEDDILQAMLSTMDQEAKDILEATIEDIRLELGTEDAESVIEVMTIMAGLANQYGGKTVARAMFAYSDFAGNLRQVGIEPRGR